jgi:tripartite-type tricarboxylate transporter receptor subunit TctC
VKTVLFVNWDSWQTFDDFLSAAKQRVMVGGVSGVGSASHLSGLVSMDELKLNPRWVNYDSGGEALASLAGKHIDFVITLGPTAFPMVKSNKIRPLIVFDEESDSVFPTTPTAKQKGIEISPTPAYFGMLAPPNTPQDRLDILEKAFLKAVNDPALQKLSNDRSLYISFISGKDYKRETERQFRLVEKYQHLLKAELK